MPATAVDLRSLIAEECANLAALRQDLHRHPEIMYEEHRTCGVVKRELDSIGVPYAAGLAGGTGVLAFIDAPGERAVALRADMDALPIAEETGLAYSSTVPGKMHACGHDGHTAILIGVARVLKRLASQGALPRPVTLVFQPAEEGGGGGARMLADGCLDGKLIGRPVERIFALHGWPWLDLGCGATREGALLASADRLNIQVHGSGGHAAWPHTVNDSVVAAAAIIMALQTIVSRRVDPLDAAVVSVATVHGGTAGNVLPDSVELTGTIRALTPAVRKFLHAEVTRLAQATAQAHGCRASVHINDGYPPTFNEPSATADVRRAMAATFGTQRALEAPRPVMGAEDFAFFGERIPAAMFVMGLHRPGDPPMPALHSPNFDFNDAAIPLGVEALCRLALG